MFNVPILYYNDFEELVKKKKKYNKSITVNFGLSGSFGRMLLELNYSKFESNDKPLHSKNDFEQQISVYYYSL